MATQQQRLRLHTAYGQAVMWSKGFAAEETRAAYLRVEKVAAEIGDAEASFEAQFAQWAHNLWRGRFGPAREAADRFLRQAERAGRPTEAAAAHRFLAFIFLTQGELAQCCAHCESTLRIYDAARDREAKFRFGQDPAAVATAYLSLATLWLGDVERARGLMDEAGALAADFGHAPTLATVHHMTAMFELFRGDADAALRAAEASVAIGRERGLALWQAYAALPLSFASAKLDGRDVASNEFRRALAEYSAGGYRFNLPFFQGLLAEIESETRGAEAALVGVDEALALAAETSERFFDAELHRTRGEILLKLNPADAAPAEAALLTAIEVARAQNGRSFELRAALALAKLYQSTGRLVEAHDVLGPALAGFSPTPEFPEIAEAQALLSEMKIAANLQKADQGGAFE